MSRGSYKVLRSGYHKSKNDKRIDRQANDPEARAVNSYVPKRGTPEWDHRELRRKRLGCMCLSFGPLP